MRKAIKNMFKKICAAKESLINPDGTLTNKGTVIFSVITLGGTWLLITAKNLISKIKK